MIETLFETLDRLIGQGSITGYTVEPPPLYLESLTPTMTYSMYAGDELSRRNITAVLDELSELGAGLTVRPVQGNVRLEDGRIQRTSQARIAARFHGGAQLEQALERIRRRYIAGSGSSWQPASWLYPDVRVTGIRRAPLGTIAALAHTMPVSGGSVVVLSLSPRPPLDGMRSHRVFLLDRWASYLDGKQIAGAWAAAPAEYQVVTPPLSATRR